MRNMNDTTSNNSATFATQVPLDDLADRVRELHAGLQVALSDAIQHAINAGQALIAAQDRIPHGGWGKFLKQCDLGERQAERYMKLARLADANPTSKSDLAGLTIEGAIKKLSPPKPNTANSAKPEKTSKESNAAVVVPPASPSDIAEVWLRASPETRQRAVDAIGFKGWFDALPPAWLPQLEQLIAERLLPSTSLLGAVDMPADLSIPEFLRRDCPGEDEHDTADASDTSSDALEEGDEVEDEAELKPRRVKMIEREMTLDEVVEAAFGDLADLANECREIVENASDGLRQTQRIQTLEDTADELENLEAPEVPETLGAITVQVALPKRRYCSREARANDATTMLEAIVTAIQEVADSDSFANDLQSAIDTVGGCEFPGMYQ